MKRYRFNDGHEITTNLHIADVCKRMKRLDTLRVLTEGYEEGVGADICKKALRAYNKEQFTGIIRLTNIEKEFLGYVLEDETTDDDEAQVLRFYIYGR